MQHVAKLTQIVPCKANLSGWIVLRYIYLSTYLDTMFGLHIFQGAYISETSHTKLRRILGTFQASGSMLGYLLANIMGVVFDDWRNSALVLSVVPLLGSVTMLLFPETPYWLASVGRLQDSRYDKEYEYACSVYLIWIKPFPHQVV